jgi:hypothetical protein
VLVTDLVVTMTIGPHYLDKTAAAVIDQDAGYWLLDAEKRNRSYPVFHYSIIPCGLQNKIATKITIVPTSCMNSETF